MVTAKTVEGKDICVLESTEKKVSLVRYLPIPSVSVLIAYVTIVVIAGGVGGPDGVYSQYLTLMVVLGLTIIFTFIFTVLFGVLSMFSYDVPVYRVLGLGSESIEKSGSESVDAANVCAAIQRAEHKIIAEKKLERIRDQHCESIVSKCK